MSEGVFCAPHEGAHRQKMRRPLHPSIKTPPPHVGEGRIQFGGILEVRPRGAP